MNEITKQQAANFWNYCTLSSPLEMQFYIAIPKLLPDTERLHLDEVAKDYAEYLADVINAINPPLDGDNNKDVCILNMARAYVKYLRDIHGNDRFMNPGSFFLICTRIAKHVK